MIKNVLIFILLQIYLRGKNMISERGGGKNMIFNVVYWPLWDPGCAKIRHGSGSRANFEYGPDPGKNDTDPDPAKKD